MKHETLNVDIKCLTVSKIGIDGIGKAREENASEIDMGYSSTYKMIYEVQH